MPTSLTLTEHLAALATAGPRLAEFAATAGWDAAVPTCPAWDVRALVAHQAMVHRWSTAQIVGTDPDAVPNQTALQEHDDLAAYYNEGLDVLIAALRAAPEDLQAMTFLNDAPPPRQFWARRQAHETTMHAVDAQAAALGRTPTTSEVGVTTELAVDGLDELLCGFFTRGRSKLFDGEEYSFAVAPTDADAAWTVHVAERLTVSPGVAAGDVPALRGTAAALYLALWNRGDEIADGHALLARWRETQKVRW